MNRIVTFALGSLSSLFILAWSPATFGAGDPARGSTLYHSTYKCTDCHR